VIVACVLWKGDFRTRTYDVNWVYNLKDMVDRHIKIPYDFVCFTNEEKQMPGISKIQISDNLKGWWAKMNIFNPNSLPKYEKVLFLDLDILILKPLTPIIEFFKSSDHLIFAPDMGACPSPKTICKYNSGVIMFKSGVMAIDDIYLKFITEKEKWMERFRGDQDYLGHITGRLPTFPKDWFIKIRNIKNASYENIPKESKIVFMNPIKNDKASEKYPWINDYWNRY